MSGIKEKNDKIELLKNECRLAKVPFQKVGIIYPRFWEELHDVIMQKPHEQKQILNGVIFTKEFNQKDFNVDIPNETRNYYLDNSTNGRNIFSIFSKDSNETRTLIFYSELTQSDLLSYTNDQRKNNVIITRENSEVRVYYHGTISVLDNRIWNIYKRKTDIIQILNKKLVSIPENFETLLEYAYYDLALNKIGTTLVFYSDESNINSIEMDVKKPKEPIDLNNQPNRALLKNYAKNHDGAIIVNSSNQVIGINAKLNLSDKALKVVKSNFTGMRHTSSAAYSYDHKTTLIITVSDDGGATVFRQGKVVFDMKSELSSVSEELQHNVSQGQLNFSNYTHIPLNNRSQKRNYNHLYNKLKKTQNFAEDLGEISEIGSATAICPRCGRKYIIGFVRISGWNDHEELECKKCGSIYYSKSCFELIGELVNDDK